MAGIELNRFSRLRHYLAALAIALWWLPGAVYGALEIIELQGRPAAEIIPLVRPLVGQEVGLSGDGYRLIVRGSERDIAELRRIIASIDTPLRNLLLRVRTVQLGTSQSMGVDVSGQVGNTGENDVQVRASGQSGEHDARGEFRLRTLEGQPARIETSRLNLSYAGTTASSSGVYVTLRVRGTRVMMEISPHAQRTASHGVTVGSRIDTVVSGPLDQWFELGGVHTSQSSDNRWLLGAYRNSAEDGFVTQVRVSLLE